MGDHENAETLGKKLFSLNNNQEKINESSLIIVVSESKIDSIPPISSKILSTFPCLSKKLILDIDSGCAGFVQALQVVDAFSRLILFSCFYYYYRLLLQIYRLF